MSFYTEFSDYYELIFPFSTTVYTFLRHYIIPKQTRCLDVGCGTGHYCGRFAAAGAEAVGIDLDAAMIAYARAHYPHAEFHTMNMLDVTDFDRPFDAVYCIGNTAAHLTPKYFRIFVDRVRSICRPGAPWILQVMNWDYVLTRTQLTLPVIEAGSATFYREYRDISEARVTFHTRLEVEGHVIFDDAVPLYPLRSDDIVHMHTDTGFSFAEHFVSYARVPFDPKAFSANIFVFYNEET